MVRRQAMVSEDDPQWERFWAVYPHRVSKQDARAAWRALSPDSALVDRMLDTLHWQTTLWAQQGYGTPYPASWLRAERWTDEPPVETVSLSPRTARTLAAAASILREIRK